MEANRAQEVKAQLARKGVSVAQWSAANNLSVMTVYSLLAGRQKGNRGESHRAAVLLGLKDGEVVSGSDVKSAVTA